MIAIDFQRDYLAWIYDRDRHGRQQLFTITVLHPTADDMAPAVWAFGQGYMVRQFRLCLQDGHFLTYEPAPDLDAAWAARMQPMAQQICSRCQQRKSLTEFHRNRQAK